MDKRIKKNKKNRVIQIDTRLFKSGFTKYLSNGPWVRDRASISGLVHRANAEEVVIL